VPDHLQEPKVWAELCYVSVSLSVQPLHSCSGLRLLLCAGNAGCSPVFWFWVGFFSPRKDFLDVYQVILTWVGCPLLCLLGAGGILGKRAEGRGIPSCLQRLPAPCRGCRAEPQPVPQSDLIFQVLFPRCPLALMQGTPELFED